LGDSYSNKKLYANQAINSPAHDHKIKIPDVKFSLKMRGRKFL